jgi:GNAT superfamily N-acetyltransferase
VARVSDEGTPTALAERWCGALGTNGGADLTERLDEFPELAELVHLPSLSASVQEDSAIWWDDVALRIELGVVWALPAANDTRFASVLFDVDTFERSCELHDMHVEPAFRRSRFGRLYLATLAQLCEDLGVEAITLMANDVGRYSWARMGFDFFDVETRDRVLAAAQDFAAALGRPVDLAGVEHAWDLAELPGEVTLAEFATARGDAAPPDPEERMRLGQALLLGPTDNEWAGKLQLGAKSPGRVRLDIYTRAHGHSS